MSLNLQNSELIITDSAAQQILLIQENDFTLEGLSFRIKIGGKGCEGFTYEAGFTQALPDDIHYQKVIPHIGTVQFVVDPFTDYYLKKGRIDYSTDPDTHNDGFTVINDEEKKHFGKFFKDESLVPHHLEIRSES